MLRITETMIILAILLIASAVATAERPPNPQPSPATAQPQPETLTAPEPQRTPQPSQRPAEAPMTLGATLDDVPDILRSHLSASLPDQRGVLVREVEDGSAAQNAGLRPTD